MPKIDISKLADLINDQLKTYEYDVLREMEKSIALVSRRAKDYIVELTPQRAGGTFKTSYINKVVGKNNKLNHKIGNKEYQLAHLLEDGHQVYTRAAGHKYDPNKLVSGPYEIEHRSTHGPNPKVKSSKLTSSYEMFKQTAEYASQELYDDVVKRIKKLKRKGKI